MPDAHHEVEGTPMTDLDDATRRARLRDVRAGLEELHAVALAERDGRVFTTEETLNQIASGNSK